jgi:hypothetical protein
MVERGSIINLVMYPPFTNDANQASQAFPSSSVATRARHLSLACFDLVLCLEGLSVSASHCVQCLVLRTHI